MPRPTITIEGKAAREAQLKGVLAIYNPVRKTLGPEPGKSLIYRSYGRGARIIDDGYMVGEAQMPRNIHVRLVAETFQEACRRTNQKVGDGTATTATIGGRLFIEAYYLLSEGGTSFTAKKSGKIGTSTLRRKIIASADIVKEHIRKVAKKTETLEELERIGAVSVGDKEIGAKLAKMAWEIGADGHIDVVEGYKGELELEINKGFRFPAKIPGRAFLTNPARFEMVLEDFHVLITNHVLNNASELGPIFSKLNAFTSKIMVIAPGFSDDVLVNMTECIKVGYFVYPVHVPSLRTEQFEDLAIYSGARFVDKSKGQSVKSITEHVLGFMDKLTVKDVEAREDAIASGGRGMLVAKGSETSDVADRVKVLKGQLEETREDQFKKLLERRIASMTSDIGIIRVGDSTQASSLDLKMKVEDAVYACRSALRGGYVKGGGLCLKEIAEHLHKDDLVRHAILAPYEQIQLSVDGGIEIGDDIIDPADATYYAVEHATEVIANLITVDNVTAEIEEMLPGEGELAIARQIAEYIKVQRKHLGQIQENEDEMNKDAMGGLTVDEKMLLDQG